MKTEEWYGVDDDGFRTHGEKVHISTRMKMEAIDGMNNALRDVDCENTIQGKGTDGDATREGGTVRQICGRWETMWTRDRCR